MAKSYSQSHTVAAPPAAVFAVLSDLDAAPKLMPEIVRVQRLGDETGPLRQGSRWIETRTGPRNKPFVSTITVTKHEQQQALELNVDHKQLAMDVAFALAPAGDGTKVDYACTVRPRGLTKLFAGRILAEVQRQDADLLQRLEKLVVVHPRGTSHAGTAAGEKSTKGKTPKGAKATGAKPATIKARASTATPQKAASPKGPAKATAGGTKSTPRGKSVGARAK